MRMTMLSIASPNRETRSVHACSYSSYVGYARVSENGGKLSNSRCPEPGMICSVLCTDMVVRGLVIRCLIFSVLIYRTYRGKSVSTKMADSRPQTPTGAGTDTSFPSTPSNAGTDTSTCPWAPDRRRRPSEVTTNGASAQTSLTGTMHSRATTPEMNGPVNNGN